MNTENNSICTLANIVSKFILFSGIATSLISAYCVFQEYSGGIAFLVFIGVLLSAIVIYTMLRLLSEILNCLEINNRLNHPDEFEEDEDDDELNEFCDDDTGAVI